MIVYGWLDRVLTDDGVVDEAQARRRVEVPQQTIVIDEQVAEDINHMRVSIHRVVDGERGVCAGVEEEVAGEVNSAVRNVDNRFACACRTLDCTRDVAEGVAAHNDRLGRRGRVGDLQGSAVDLTDGTVQILEDVIQNADAECLPDGDRFAADETAEGAVAHRTAIGAGGGGIIKELDRQRTSEGEGHTIKQNGVGGAELQGFDGDAGAVLDMEAGPAVVAVVDPDGRLSVVTFNGQISPVNDADAGRIFTWQQHDTIRAVWL